MTHDTANKLSSATEESRVFKIKTDDNTPRRRRRLRHSQSAVVYRYINQADKL